MNQDLENAIAGCLLGAAIGDALGLPMEGLSRRRRQRMYPLIDGHRFFWGRGMVSDDTEHLCLTAQALTVSAGAPDIFARDLGRRLKWWLAGLPAGIGLATLRALVKLWLGFPPHKSGVFSAGNGPAMRSAVIGVCYGDDPERLMELVRASTRLTHTDAKAEYGAAAVALAAHWAAKNGGGPDDFARLLRERLDQEAGELMDLIDRAAESATQGRSTVDFAADLGLERGVIGYMYHSVPAALHAWFRHPRDYRAAMIGALQCGGDTDTVGAILGGILGAGLGGDGLPPDWLHGLKDWPMSRSWIAAQGEQLARTVTDGRGQKPLPRRLYAVWPRNLFFMLLVLAHGFRRLAPPY